MNTALQVVFAIVPFLVLLVAWGAFVGGACKTTDQCPAGYQCTRGQCLAVAPASFRSWRGALHRKGAPPA